MNIIPFSPSKGSADLHKQVKNTEVLCFIFSNWELSSIYLMIKEKEEKELRKYTNLCVHFISKYFSSYCYKRQ